MMITVSRKKDSRQACLHVNPFFDEPHPHEQRSGKGPAICECRAGEREYEVRSYPGYHQRIVMSKEAGRAPRFASGGPRDNQDAGTATIVFIGTGDYKGSVTKTFTIKVK